MYAVNFPLISIYCLFKNFNKFIKFVNFYFFLVFSTHLSITQKINKKKRSKETTFRFKQTIFFVYTKKSKLKKMQK